MAGRKRDFTLPKFDDIFSTQEMRDDEKLATDHDPYSDHHCGSWRYRLDSFLPG